MPQAGPASHFFATPAERITTISGMPQAVDPTTFQTVHHDTVHRGGGMPQAGPAETFGTGIVVYVNDSNVPGINAGGMATAGPALPIGHL